MEDVTSEIPVYRLNEISFRLYTTAEIKALSVLEVTNPQTFDILSHPTYGGLHDPALGPSNRNEVCTTCGLSYVFCPGHMGHISLPLPVFNPVYFPTLVKLLKGTCFDCQKLMMDYFHCRLFIEQMALLERGDATGAFKLEAYGEYLTTERGKEDYDLTPQLEEYLEENFPVPDSADNTEQHFINFKNIQAVRNSLSRKFVEVLTEPKKFCPQCKCPTRKVQQKYNRTVGLYGKSSKDTNKSRKSPASKSKAKSGEADEEEEREADIEELEADDNDKVKDVEEKEFDNSIFKDNQSYTHLTPSLVRDHVREVWKTASPLLKILFESLSKVSDNTHPTDIFFLEVIPVCPTRYRPIAMLKGRQYENPQTANLCHVLNDKVNLTQIIHEIAKKSKDILQGEQETDTILPQSVVGTTGTSISAKLNNAWMSMQSHVNCLVDSSLDKLSKDGHDGIKQLLEKKSGLFRKNMMGKRVNYAARSVISPDPCINVSEIGVPYVFAKKLTYPQPVTPWNFQELKQMVINGPDTHPGALCVEMENGVKVNLNKDRTHREAVAKQLLTPSTTTTRLLKPKIVYRHLKNGDYMLVNRQPTLHRPSIQAHRVRVLPGQKTLRLHYANCKAYNADFDGDEMNAHFPQSELARAEAMMLASTDNQYLVPKDGTPLAGLIQDHMVSGVSLTVRGRFFNKADYFQLLYATLTDISGPVKTLPPAIIKPYRMWSGKQVLSSVLLNVIPDGKQALNLQGKSKIPEKNWTFRSSSLSRMDLDDLGESCVVIRDGELLQGVLDKAHYGPTRYGMVHSCYELYGGHVAGKLLSCLGKLFRVFLQMRGFTLGVEDILVRPKAENERVKIVKKSPECGREAAMKALGTESDISDTDLLARMKDAHLDLDDRSLREQDIAMKQKTDQVQNNIVKECIPRGLHKPFPENNLQLMVEAGAKGSSVNCMQISCLLGQIELEGRRPPLMISGRTLPSFLPYDTQPRAGGFVAQRFLTGIKAPEYFFHCMAGREGLVDTAVKTSRSGYLQRCIIKHMEGLQVAYDMTVRDSDGSVIQFCYGEDGLETTKTPFLSPKQFPFLLLNRHAHHIPDEGDEKVKKKIKKLNKKIKSWKKKHKEDDRKVRKSDFLRFCEEEKENLVSRKDLVKMVNGRTRAAAKLQTAWRQLDDDTRAGYSCERTPCPAPVLTQFRPFQHSSVMSEKLMDSLTSFCDHQLEKLKERLPSGGDVTAKSFQKLFSHKVLSSYAQPGDTVGLVCAQSIGEPSTQMTLNTFHFAGRGEMNVTLGIPRLREILQTASPNIKTPAMDVPVLKTPGALERARRLKVKLAKVTLAQVVQDVKATEFITAPKGNPQFTRRNFRVRFTFLPESSYEDMTSVCSQHILSYMENKYLLSLITLLKNKMKLISKASTVDMARMNRSAFLDAATSDRITQRGGDDDEDDEEVDPNDGDAVTQKEQARQTDTQEYEEGEEDQEEGEEDELGEEDMEQTPHLSDSEDESGSEEDIVTLQEEIGKKKKYNFAKRKPTVELAEVNENITEYKFDKKKGLWCEVVFSFELHKSKIDVLTVIQSNLKMAVVHQVAGINQTFLVEETGPGGSEWHLKTEGVNIEEMHKYVDILDLNRLHCNDVHAFAKVYGIEAAARVLLKEISSVFAAYGIEVDYRHLSLLTDYMTFEGAYKGMNRNAINNNVAPFQKMTFETCMKFLVDASINSNFDHLASPSSRLVAGQVLRCGTGSFEIKQSLV